MMLGALIAHSIFQTVLCFSQNFVIKEGFKFSNNVSLIDARFSRNSLHCATRCLSYVSCKIASFDQETSTCALHENAELSSSVDNRYEIMEIAGRGKAVSENQMTTTSPITGTLDSTMTSETTGTPETTKTSGTTETLETTGTSRGSGIYMTTGKTETTMTSETTETRGTSETRKTTETAVSSGTTMISEIRNWTVLGADDCFPSTSLEYSGTFSRTVSGIPCQYWNQNNNPHNIWNPPVDTTAHDTNYCRETTNREGSPICYTTDPNVQWEYCFIVKCDACDVDARLPPVPGGTTYSFQVGKNIGMMFACDSLTQGTSVEHCPVSMCGDDDQWTTDYAVSCSTEDCYTISSAYLGKVTCTVSGRPCMIWSVAGRVTPTGPDGNTNYCRDPDNTGKPWCYVSTSPNIVWDYCPVPKCLY